jgi:hypothetical protein
MINFEQTRSPALPKDAGLLWPQGEGSRTMHAIFPKNTSRPSSELLKRQEYFQPTEVATLCAVFEDVLKTLGLIDRRDVLTTMIARKMVELANTGVRDPVRLKQRTLRAFEAGKPTRSVPTVRIV